ncbi:Protein MAIN-LIKE 2, partial [Linum grandiflorum]
SARSRIAPVRGTCSLHSRSVSDHGVDGALETGNEHLPHVPLIVLTNSSGCCALDGLISYGRRYVEYEKEANWAAIVEDVLGKSTDGYLKDDGRVKMGWLHDHFYSCTDVVDEAELRQYACAYMLSIIGAFMLADRSSAYVHCQYLLAFRERRPFAWGVAVLSWMYRELGKVTLKIEGGPSSTSAGDIGG